MTVRTKITQGGRIVIPADMRRRLGMGVGESVNLEENGSSLTISTGPAALRRLQESLMGALPEGVSLADELIADRKKEAKGD